MIRKFAPYPGADTQLAQYFASGMLSLGGTVDTKDIANTLNRVMTDMQAMIKPWIKSGLDVSASAPADNFIIITSGSGFGGGRRQILNRKTSLWVPLNSGNVWFINLNDGHIHLDAYPYDHTLNIGKIVVPNPGKTTRIQDDKTDSWDGYIVSAKDMYYNEDTVFDDTSREVLRDAIGDIMGENIIGTIKCNEGLQITNEQGTVKITSKDVQILYDAQRVAAKFNKTGTYYYDYNGNEWARYTKDHAKIGNIIIETRRLRSKNFRDGITGFEIRDDGNAQFNDATIRGTLHANVGEIGNWTINSSGIYSDNSDAIIQGGRYQTSATAETDGVILDKDGLRGYNSTFGEVFNLPTDASAPTFSSGVIRLTEFEIYTSGVIRTSATVGDGTANSAGILINNAGIYAYAVNQTGAGANVRILKNGDAYFKGDLDANSGTLANLNVDGTITVGTDGDIRSENYVSGASGFKIYPAGGIELWEGKLAGNVAFGEITIGDVSGWHHSSDVTKIDGGDIYTNTVTANAINVANLAAINADLGTITAGTITGASMYIGNKVTLDSNGIEIHSNNTPGTAILELKERSAIHIYNHDNSSDIPLYHNDDGTLNAIVGLNMGGAGVAGNLSLVSDGKLYLFSSDNASYAYLDYSSNEGVYIYGYTSGNPGYSIADLGRTLCTFTPQIRANSGIRIGADSDDNRIDDSSHGSSVTLYIGNRTIDTSAVSDKRFKQNIVPTKYGLEDILKMNAIDFQFTKEYQSDDKVHTGFIAQEIETIYPDCIIDREDGIKAIDYKKIVPLLVKGIQELNTKVEKFLN